MDTWTLQIIEKHHPLNLLQWTLEEDSQAWCDSWRFDFSYVQFCLKTLINGPGVATRNIAECKLVDKGMQIPRKTVDSLRISLRQLFFVSVDLRPPDLAVVILQALEDISAVEEELKETSAKRQSLGSYDASAVDDWHTIIDSVAGVDINTIADTALEVLGTTPRQIHAAIPSEWRVVHIESVLRPDHTARFYQYREELRQSLKEAPISELRKKLPPHSVLDGRIRATLSRADLIEDMTRPRVTYHGTKLRSVSSIIRHGFRKPGDLVHGKVIASPRTGIVYDRGIYSSQTSWYAMSYAKGEQQKTPIGTIPSMRLFVCATIMGRTCFGIARKGIPGMPVHGPLIEGFDSHFDGRHEYIIHDDRAMLPCYVVHLDLGSEAAKVALRTIQADPTVFERERVRKIHPKLKTGEKGPGDEQREKAARKAAAQKWFPFGFGTASGTNFVIEAIAEISDDEEEYGEWQEDKHTFMRDDELHDEGVDDLTSSDRYHRKHFMDQYQGFVHGKGGA